MSPQILIVEDDEVIGWSLQRALEATGYAVEWVTDGATALARLQTGSVDLVLLDLGLPDGDGVELGREMLTLDSALPVIMLTARTEEADVVAGLHAGAVDYVTKPFRLAELLARIQAHLRSVQRHVEAERMIFVQDLRIDLAARRVWVGDDEVELRPKEFEVLACLAQAAGQVVSRERLINEVWDENWFGSTKTLDVHIASLRRRLGEEAGAPSRITALRGVGYRLETS